MISPKNKLLAALPSHVLGSLSELLEMVPLRSRRVLHQPRAPIDQVYFVEEGLVSVIAETGDGHEAEVWLTGCAGLVGVPAALGMKVSTHRRVVHAPGYAFRMSAANLQSAMHQMAELRELLLLHAGAVLVQASQSGACNATHHLKPRLARWLLLAADQYPGRDLPLTHRMLARILGVRRPSVTECLAVLADERLVQNSRGRIAVIDRAGLEATACACYHIIRKAEERVFRDFDQAVSAGNFRPAPRRSVRCDPAG